jgi:hypothetical protein
MAGSDDRVEMEAGSRKRRVDQLQQHFEAKLAAKRRKLEDLQKDFRLLEFELLACHAHDPAFQPIAEQSASKKWKNVPATLDPALEDSSLSGEEILRLPIDRDCKKMPNSQK